MMRIERYAEGQTVRLYGAVHPVQPVRTHHGATLGYLPGQSVGYFRDGFLQDVTIHESAYDAGRYAEWRAAEARMRPMPYLHTYRVI